MSGIVLEPGTLLTAIERATEHGLACGALKPIETEQQSVAADGATFLVRMVSSLARKAEDKAKRQKTAAETGNKVNPFLPPDADLFVADISDTHIGLLNKFNVIERHLLVVTRDFEDQETLLTLADFRAWWACMAEFEGLGFYNGGVVAGASQPHKHLQMVPLPFADGQPPTPIESLFDGLDGPAVPALPFRHAFRRLPPGLADDPLAAAAITQDHYRNMLDAVGAGGTSRQSAPYNFLMTRRWMLAVPRSREFFGAVSINGLGYAGSLFVRDEAQMQAIRDAGPLAVLQYVSVAA